MSKQNNSEERSINQAIRNACQQHLGVLDQSFLCQTVGVLNPPPPLCVPPSETLEAACLLFKEKSVGSLLVTGPDQKLVGIITERDLVRKTLPNFEALRKKPVSEFMTPNPIAESADITIAFALNLMSQGGFRHLPLVDGSGIPVGVISVRDMMDHIVGSFVEQLLNFDVSGPESLV